VSLVNRYCVLRGVNPYNLLIACANWVAWHSKDKKAVNDAYHILARL
jgi:hypothetical protein